MITGEDIDNLGEELSKDESEKLVSEAEQRAKDILRDVLNKYASDTRKVTAEAMTYTALSIIEVCLTGLLMMSGGNRKALDELIETMIKDTLDRIEENKKAN
jgi:hypothetical protein